MLIGRETFISILLEHSGTIDMFDLIKHEKLHASIGVLFYETSGFYALYL